VAIECKANGGVPTALQLREMDKITKGGGLSFIIAEDTLDKLKAYLLLIKERQS
jgi:hypothetical protein